MEIKLSPAGRPVTILLSQEDVQSAVIGWLCRAIPLHSIEKALRLAVRDGKWVGLPPDGIGIGIDVDKASFPGDGNDG